MTSYWTLARTETKKGADGGTGVERVLGGPQEAEQLTERGDASQHRQVRLGRQQSIEVAPTQQTFAG